MTREQGPKFSEKHGADTMLDPTVKKKIEDKAKKQEIACAVAFQIAEELKKTPSDIGKSIDLLDIRLVKCQLGLFGYTPEKKAVKPKSPQRPEMKEAIHKAMEDHKVTDAEFNQIMKIADEDGHLDPEEKALLAELQQMILDGIVKRTRE